MLDKDVSYMENEGNVEKSNIREELTQRTKLTTIAKICMFMCGFSNFWLGYAIYFLMYDTDREKAGYFKSGAFTSIIVAIILFVVYAVIEFFG